MSCLKVIQNITIEVLYLNTKRKVNMHKKNHTLHQLME